MQQWNLGRGFGVGAGLAIAACLVLVTSTLAVAGAATSSTGLSGGASGFTPTPLLDPTCTVTVTGENVENNALQSAVDAASPGATICISAGVYPEQLNISTPGLTLFGLGGSSGTILEPKAPLAFNTDDFDSGTSAAAIVSVSNTTGVTLEDLQVSGLDAQATFSNCGQDYFGVAFQNASGSVLGAVVTNVTLPHWLFGCQPGIAVYADNGYLRTHVEPSPAISLLVANSTITNYDKGGVVCDDLGETCTISSNTVSGIGSTDLIAQNGIQVAFGADALVSGNVVSNNSYSPTQNVDYFTANEGNAPCGILVYDGGNSISIAGNQLSENTQGICLAGTASASVAHNTIFSGSAYGITFDLNASIGYLGFPIYSTDTPWTSLASDNTISGVNVGVLVYDDNVTISGGSMTDVNVSVEAMTDHAGSSYAVAVDSLSATTNVGGALLGDLSSFQATPGFYPKAVAAYSLSRDTFDANPLAPPAAVQDGILLDGSSASVFACGVTGYAVGITVNPTIASATIENSTVSSTATLGEPEVGIWAGNFVYPTTLDSGTIVISGNTVTGPGGGNDSPLAGGTGIVAGGASVLIEHNRVSDYSAFSGADGVDWWEGTQSVGILFGCPPTVPAADCVVEDNTVVDNTIGVTVILTNLTFSAALETGPVTIADNTIADSSGYGLFTEMDWFGPGAPATSTIEGNTFNNSLTGAPAMVLSGQTFDVVHNVLIGTSPSGDQGPEQGQGGGPLLPTASVEATSYWTTGTDTVTLDANLFVDTSVYWSATFAQGSGSTLSGGELVTFTEVGLRTGTSWSIALNGTTASVLAPGPLVGDLQNGSGSFVVPPVPGYTATPSGGGLTIVGAGVSQEIVFSSAAFPVTFTEHGLPLGATWWLYVSGGPALSSSSTTLAFSELNGNYTYSFGITVAAPRDYSAPGGGFTVSGAPVSVAATFVPVREMKVTERNLPLGTEWWVNLTWVQTTFVNGTSFHSTGTTISLYVGSGKYEFTYASANSTYGQLTHRFTVKPVATVAPRTFSAAFHRVFYAVSFLENGLPAGAHWCADLAGQKHCSTGARITFRETNGFYSYTLTTTKSGYSAPGGDFRVHGAPTSLTVTFSR